MKFLIVSLPIKAFKQEVEASSEEEALRKTFKDDIEAVEKTEEPEERVFRIKSSGKKYYFQVLPL